MLRRLCEIFLLSLLSASVLATERGPALPDYPAEQVAARTYVIHGPVAYPSVENQGFMNNPAFIITAQGVIVVDPGASVQSGEMVLRQIRKLTDGPLLAVLNTHEHGDHWLGNQALREAQPGVPIYALPEMLAAVAAGADADWLGRMEQLTEGATRGTVAVGPNLEVRDGDQLKVGGLTFRFHHTGPGHTGSDLMIEVVEESLLFLGDNVCNGRIVRQDHGSFRGNIQAADRALELALKVYVPGHGRTADAAMVEDYRHYLQTLYDVVATGYEEGLGDYEIKPLVVEALADYQEWFGFEVEIGKLVSETYLEVEAAEFE